MNLDFPDGDEEMEGTDRDKKDEKHERDKQGVKTGVGADNNQTNLLNTMHGAFDLTSRENLAPPDVT